ncbi:hypothetical protein R3P38DRAFT_2903397 [Favolaschia claudopus]|uniref:Uncharacterized protein n=1 Tax=Favolaschia claudopus TaxID=2862362 RepID=A0AAW0CFI2_9AGAR
MQRNAPASRARHSPFIGTAIDVLGTIQVSTLADNTIDLSGVCLVDDIQITDGTNPKFQLLKHNWILCHQETIRLVSLLSTFAPIGQFYLDGGFPWCPGTVTIAPFWTI